MRHHQRLIATLLLTAACAAPLAAGELIVPLAGDTAADGTAYATRVWVTNTGSTPRRWTYSFIAPGTDGTRAGTGRAITVAPGATVLATGLAPSGQGGMLLVSGPAQLLTTARLEATGPNGALRGATAGPLVSATELAPARATLHLHGLSQKQGGLVTDLHLINAARQPAQCTVDAFREDGSRIAATARYTLPALSVRALDRALAGLGATSIDEARFAVSCDKAFYAFARVYKPGSAELNVVTPSRPLG
jgi:hypothetical protein